MKSFDRIFTEREVNELLGRGLTSLRVPPNATLSFAAAVALRNAGIEIELDAAQQFELPTFAAETQLACERHFFETKCPWIDRTSNALLPVEHIKWPDGDLW